MIKYDIASIKMNLAPFPSTKASYFRLTDIPLHSPKSTQTTRSKTDLPSTQRPAHTMDDCVYCKVFGNYECLVPGHKKNIIVALTENKYLSLVESYELIYLSQQMRDEWKSTNFYLVRCGIERGSGVGCIVDDGIAVYVEGGGMYGHYSYDEMTKSLREQMFTEVPIPEMSYVQKMAVSGAFTMMIQQLCPCIALIGVEKSQVDEIMRKVNISRLLYTLKTVDESNPSTL